MKSHHYFRLVIFRLNISLLFISCYVVLIGNMVEPDHLRKSIFKARHIIHTIHTSFHTIFYLNNTYI